MEIIWEKNQLQRKTQRMYSNQPQTASHLLDILTLFLDNKNGQLSSYPPGWFQNSHFPWEFKAKKQP